MRLLSFALALCCSLAVRAANFPSINVTGTASANEVNVGNPYVEVLDRAGDYYKLQLHNTNDAGGFGYISALIIARSIEDYAGANTEFGWSDDTNGFHHLFSFGAEKRSADTNDVNWFIAAEVLGGPEIVEGFMDGSVIFGYQVNGPTNPYFARISTNGLEVTRTVSANAVIGTNGVSTGAPSGGTAAAWKLGSYRTNYVEAEVGGNSTRFVTEDGSGNVVLGSLTVPDLYATNVYYMGLTTNKLLTLDVSNKVAVATEAVFTNTIGRIISGTGALIAASAVSANQTNATLASLGGVATNTIVGALGITTDGGGTLPAAATVKGYTVVPYTGHITGWSIVSDGTSPTCTWDVWKVASGTSLPAVGNTIMGTKPALSTGNAVRSTTLTGWTTNFTAGDIIGWNLDSVGGTPTRITLTLETVR